MSLPDLNEASGRGDAIFASVEETEQGPMVFLSFPEVEKTFVFDDLAAMHVAEALAACAVECRGRLQRPHGEETH